MSKRDQKIEEDVLRFRLAILSTEPKHARPKTRGDCLPGGMNEVRPCPYAACKYHLALDVSKSTGTVRNTFPGRSPEEYRPKNSCALDVADQGGETLERVGELLNLTRERVRQMETRGLALIKEACEDAGLDEDDFEQAPDVSEPAGAEDGAMGAYADPEKEEPNARLRLMFHKVANARAREKAIARGEKVAPTSSSDEEDTTIDLATQRAIRGKVGALVPWTDEDQIDLEMWLAHHELLQPEIVGRASALFNATSAPESSHVVLVEPSEEEQRPGAVVTDPHSDSPLRSLV